MNVLFLEYPKCTTCKKAKKFLQDQKIGFDERHIVENNPTKEELKEWLRLSGLPIKKFFNSSGMKYRELNMKDKVKELSENELLEILSTDGMLVKRPLIITGEKVMLGFKEEAYKDFFNL